MPPARRAPDERSSDPLHDPLAESMSCRRANRCAARARSLPASNPRRPAKPRSSLTAKGEIATALAAPHRAGASRAGARRPARGGFFRARRRADARARRPSVAPQTARSMRRSACRSICAGLLRERHVDACARRHVLVVAPSSRWRARSGAAAADRALRRQTLSPARLRRRRRKGAKCTAVRALARREVELRNPSAGARCSRARAAGGSFRRSGGAAPSRILGAATRREAFRVVAVEAGVGSALS